MRVLIHLQLQLIMQDPTELSIGKELIKTLKKIKLIILIG